MATLTGKLGSWELPHVHMWKDRRRDILAAKRPLIHAKSRIGTIGSCFAAELASAMQRLRLDGAMHPAGLFYTPRSIRQEMERIFVGPGPRESMPMWKTTKGFVHPFKEPHRAFPTEAELKAWSDAVDREAEQIFKGCDIAVITLGLIEAWIDPASGAAYTQIPHPDVFPSIGAELHRLTVAEMLDDLRATVRLLRAHTKAEIILTVSPVPLHATMTPYDVRVANTESKSRIRAAVSELIDQMPDVHYFHSYEMVTTAERQSDFMMEDGRHVERRAVEYILNTFLHTFGGPDLAVPEVDTSWLTAPTKLAERVTKRPRSLTERVVGRLQRIARL
jgi:hypothetical protein